MIPPSHGDTTILDKTEMWVGKSLEEIANATNTVVTTAPEPGTLALIGLAAAAFGFSRRRTS